MSYSKEHIAPKPKRGLLTIEQYLVLKYRAKGFTQLETANALSMSRANVSMIESRARRKIDGARATLRAYESLLTTHSVIIEKGTRLQQLPSIVLNEGDRQGIHIKSNLIDIIRMVKSFEPRCVRDGRTIYKMRFDFNPGGKLSLVKLRERKR